MILKKNKKMKIQKNLNNKNQKQNQKNTQKYNFEVARFFKQKWHFGQKNAKNRV